MNAARQHGVCVCILFALLAVSAHAQSLKSALLEKARKEKTPSTPVLLIVYPENKLKTDSKRVRYGGAVEPGTGVSLNENTIKIYDSGAFAGIYSLNVGKNVLTFVAASPEEITTRTLTITRTPPSKTLPSLPLVFDKTYSIKPSKNMLLRYGDVLELRVKGSRGHRATFRINGNEEEYPMRELPPRGSGALEGIYKSYYTIQPTDTFSKSVVTFRLYNTESQTSQYIETQARGTVTVDKATVPALYKVKESHIYLYSSPSSGNRLFSTLPESILYSTGKIGDMLRISLSPSITGWIDAQYVENAFPAPLPDFSISNLSCYSDKGSSFISLTLPGRVPFMTKYHPEALTLTLDVFGARPGFRWINLKKKSPLISDVRIEQPEDRRARVKVYLSEPLLGYHTRYTNNTLIVELRTFSLLKSSDENVLKGITICLDPGHGGSDKGAIGNTGLYEKDANLFLTRLLKPALEAHAAKVLVTRDNDITLSNGTRIDSMNDTHARLFISIHNNSVSEYENPLGARGVGVFFHQPQSHVFAEHLYDTLISQCPELEPYGIIQSDHLLLREITSAPCVLIEGLFLSNPLDEMLLMNDNYCERFVTGVVTGIQEYLVSISQ